MWKAFLKTFLLTLVFLSILLGLTAAAAIAWANGQWRTFANTAQTSWPDFYQQLRDGWQKTPQSDRGRSNFLILGIDSLPGRQSAPPMTDTILLVSIDLPEQKIYTLPLPRDLWDDYYQTKINALYAYSRQQFPDDPFKLPREEISRLAQIPIHHTLVVSLSQISQLIDILDGVPIQVEKSFTDRHFPKPNVDVTKEHDPAKLYMTVEFSAGTEIMSGERALIYMRSRYSDDPEQGNDLAREKRQQQVVQAIIQRLQDRQILFSAAKLGRLYRFYNQNWRSSLPLSEIIALAKKLYPWQKITLNNQQLTVYPDDPEGAIYHPPIWQTKNIWQWRPYPDWPHFTQTVRRLLAYPPAK